MSVGAGGVPCTSTSSKPSDIHYEYPPSDPKLNPDHALIGRLRAYLGAQFERRLEEGTILKILFPKHGEYEEILPHFGKCNPGKF